LSTLTKIAVVLLAVLVLMACPIFIAGAVTGYNWKQAFQGEHARRLMADAKARSEEAAADVWKRWGEEQKRTGEALARQYRTDMDAKRMQIARLTTEKAGLTTLTEKLAADIKELRGAYNKAVELTKEQRDDLKTEQARNITLADQLREAQAKIQELLADVALLNRGRESLKEKIADKDVEIRDLRDELEQLQEAGAVARKPVPKGPKIEATVTAVKVDTASLNVGSASGVKKGMEFVIYRGASYVAHLQVEHVTASTCAGIVVDALLDVKQGDKATTRLGED
jgi:vacuolar-type H+-ATPase subunit I/STV1